MLQEICHDVEIEPQLSNLTGEKFKHKTANMSDDARVDVAARGFWVRGRKAYMGIRVFNPLAKRYSTQTLSAAHRANEQEKKRLYNERILQVDHGTFTPLVFSSFGGMSFECNRFYKRLGEMIAEKRDVSQSMTMCWLRTKLSFSLLRTALLCIRGSRSIRKIESEPVVTTDIVVASFVADGSNLPMMN